MEKPLLHSYADAARVIMLYLQRFCDQDLPADEMIAEASRRAHDYIESQQKIIDRQDELIKQLQEPTKKH